MSNGLRKMVEACKQPQAEVELADVIQQMIELLIDAYNQGQEDGFDRGYKYREGLYEAVQEYTQAEQTNADDTATPIEVGDEVDLMNDTATYGWVADINANKLLVYIPSTQDRAGDLITVDSHAVMKTGKHRSKPAIKTALLCEDWCRLNS